MSQHITDAKKTVDSEDTIAVDRDALAKVVSTVKDIAEDLKKAVDAKKADLKEELKKVSEYEHSEDETVIDAYLEAVRDKLDDVEFVVYEAFVRLDD